jgi:hypothetical protein
MRSRGLFWLLAGAMGLGAPSLFAGSAPGPGERSPLPSTLNLPDEAFFAGTTDSKLEAALLDSRFVGVALRAPKGVDLGSQTKLPLLVASRFDGARDCDFPLSELGWLVGVEMASGDVRIAPAFGSGKKQAPEERGARPSRDELGSYGAQVTLLDARARLDLPWRPGCWAFTLIYFDWVSNTVASRLTKADDTADKRDVACAQLSSTTKQLTYQIQRRPDGRVRVSGRYGFTVDGLPEHSKGLPASLLLVTSDGAAPRRMDWQIPLAPGTRAVRGDLDHSFASEDEPAAGAVVYLTVAGRIYGPRPWPAKPAQPAVRPR